jgi:A/G-specific adenine glycosylase
LCREVGLVVALGPELLTIAHGITRYHITIVCFEAEWRGGEVACDHYAQAVWVEPGRLGEYPVSAPQRRLARHLTRPDAQRRLF